ncbi:MAG: hypothetical protein PHQ23_17220, partial [Candidatus Wallbacteria bacterium]|nr:hypothetical protein [Candidatus Wallbacteria bacterium]
GNGMKSEAVKIYARIKDVTAVMYEEAEAYVRKRVELEYKLREHHELANRYLEKGKLKEAKQTLEKIVSMVREME